MTEGSLTKPSHLRPAAPSRWGWVVRRPAGLVALAIGVATFVTVVVAQPRLWATPDWRLSVPGAVVTALAAAVSLARREHGAYALWLVGLGLAGASLVLGWFFLFAIVISATAILILILHAVM